MAVGAALPEEVEWEIIDGNRPSVDPLAEIAAHVERRRGTADPVRVVAFTVMPGPQLVSAVPLTRAVKARYPEVQTVWGGNFGSLYPASVLNAPYVDWVVRGQGEHAFRELLEVIDGDRDPESRAGAVPGATRTGGTASTPSAPGWARTSCRRRRITGSRWTTTSIPPSWGGAAACTRRPSAARSAASSAG